jgi:hypothetical protein
MNKPIAIVIFLMPATLFLCSTMYAQAVDPVSLLIAKAVKTLDLKIQGLQKETMVLQGLQQQAEQRLSQQQLKVIHQWQKALEDLYAKYFQDLQIVKPFLQRDVRVLAMMDLDRQIRGIYQRVPESKFGETNKWLIKQHQLFEQLSNVLRSGVSMSDAERLYQIDALFRDMQCVSDSLHSFEERVVRQRALLAQKQRDIQLFKKNYGLQ